MVHIYYHIYAIDGVVELIKEQMGLIQRHFKFEYKLNVGISLSTVDYDISEILNVLPITPREIGKNRHEFITLNLIKKDKEIFLDDDYIFYFHTKGITSQIALNWPERYVEEMKKNVPTWRKVMEYFNIEKIDYVFYILENTNHNTYGILYVSFIDEGILNRFYAGNYWWAKGAYIKTLRMENIDESYRMDAERKVISSGLNWKPFSPYNKNVKSHYELYFNPDEYRNLDLKHSFI